MQLTWELSRDSSRKVRMGVAEASRPPSMLKLPPVVLRRWPRTPTPSPTAVAERGEKTSFISCMRSDVSCA